MTSRIQQLTSNAHVDAVIKGDGTSYVPIKLGNAFSLAEVYGPYGDDEFVSLQYTPTAGALLYRPVHPSTTVADVQGATVAIDDGTYWRFAHASEDTHYEMALQLESAIVALFQRDVDQALYKTLTDTNNVAKGLAKLQIRRHHRVPRRGCRYVPLLPARQ